MVKVDPKYYRPTEVELLIGDATKCKKELNWEPKYNLQQMVSEMMENDVKLFKKDKFLKSSGFDVLNEYE